MRYISTTLLVLIALAAGARAEGKAYLLREYKTVDALLNALPPATTRAPHLNLHMRALCHGYGSAFTGLAVDDNEHLQVLLADGSRHLYDDGEPKSAAQRLEKSDLEDMFFDLYPLSNPTGALPEDFDPGRVRPEEFFKAVYGGSSAEVTRTLTTVDFCGKKVSFQSRNGAADSLKLVAAELKPLLAQKPELGIWLEEMGGTYNWRPIAGTNRLSTHSYGIAIDLNASKSGYWRWSKPDELKTFSRKTFPSEIIECFEHHGFIWGGKWYHFDTMHFEYRPEIIAAARLSQGLALEPAPNDSTASTLAPAEHKSSTKPSPVAPLPVGER